MGMDMRVVEWLRREGHDVVHRREVGLHRAPDEEVLAKALRDDRIVLTFDLDFGGLATLSPAWWSAPPTARRSSWRGRVAWLVPLAPDGAPTSSRLAQGSDPDREELRRTSARRRREAIRGPLMRLLLDTLVPGRRREDPRRCKGSDSSGPDLGAGQRRLGLGDRDQGLDRQDPDRRRRRHAAASLDRRRRLR